jgi:hypothetical protein
MKSMGIETPERVIFGSALALCIFFVTWLCSRARNRLLSIAALIALGGLVTALTAVRVGDNAGDDNARRIDFAEALIMMAVTIGPAVMAEHVLRLLAPALPVVRRIARFRNRLRSASRQQQSANRFVERLSIRREAWQRESARRRAIYDVAYRAARAELGDISALSTSTPPWVVPNSGERSSTALIKPLTNKERTQ